MNVGGRQITSAEFEMFSQLFGEQVHHSHLFGRDGIEARPNEPRALDHELQLRS